MPSGYSGTPLAKKLSLKDGMRVWRDGMPASVAEEIAAEGLQLQLLGVPEAPIDAAHIFVTSRGELEAKLRELMPLLDAKRHDLGELAEESLESPDRHHRRRDPRRRAANASGRREGMFGRRHMVGTEVGDQESASLTGSSAMDGRTIAKPIVIATLICGTLDILWR